MDGRRVLGWGGIMCQSPMPDAQTRARETRQIHASRLTPHASRLTHPAPLAWLEGWAAARRGEERGREGREGVGLGWGLVLE